MDRLYQEQPIFCKPSCYPAKGWTNDLCGFLYEADKASRQLRRHSQLLKTRYTFAVSINIERELPIPEVKELWRKVCRILREEKVVACWVREPSLLNHVNYHLVVRSQHSLAGLKSSIDKAMPCRSESPWHKWVEPVKTKFDWCRYITKAKPWSTNPAVHREIQEKRLMFKPKTGLRKLGHIGPFWLRPREQLWDEICTIEQRIKEGNNQEGIDELIRHVVEMLPHANPKDLARSLKHFAFERPIQEWIARLGA